MDNNKNEVVANPSVPKLPWYIKYKQQIYGVAIFIFGALGGNVDRVSSTVGEFFPPGLDAVQVEERISALENITFEQNEKITSNSGRITILSSKVEELESESKGLPYRK